MYAAIEDTTRDCWPPMIDTGIIHTCDFFHPSKNLRTSGKRRREPEAEFADLFAHAYLERFVRVHPGTTRHRTLFVREVPVHGNGIADLLVLSWEGDPACWTRPLDLARADPTMRAFEVKLSDWRSGLMQAHRYRYFSNAAILVVPKNKLKTVEPHLNLFRTLRVGLWGFENATATITNVYTPRPKRQYVAKYGAQALATAIGAASS
jgi:hypothetical protein